MNNIFMSLGQLVRDGCKQDIVDLLASQGSVVWVLWNLKLQKLVMPQRKF